MTQEDLRKAQRISHEMLDVVDNICKQHGIEYFLMFGTLLGSVRHKGSIPWDFDVDIIMTKEYWNRFADVAAKELEGTDYLVKVMGSGSTKYLNELKIGKKNTVFCMPGTEDLDVMNNVFLDVFCFNDARTFSHNSFRLFIYKIWTFLRLVKQKKDEKRLLSLCIDRSTHRNKWFYKSCLWGAHVLRMIFGEEFFEWMGYKMLVDDSGKSAWLWENANHILYKKEWFEHAVEGEYEGKKYPIPCGWHEVLTTRYGDYMQLPPENERYSKYFDEWVFKEKIDD